jgi:hypothetical protein
MKSTEDVEKLSNDTNSTVYTDDRRSAGSDSETKLAESDCVQLTKQTADPVLASIETVIFNRIFFNTKTSFRIKIDYFSTRILARMFSSAWTC